MKPTAAPAIWPYPHRNMAQVMADPLTRECPKCGAPAGYLCDGNGLRGGDTHTVRRRA